MNALIDPVIIKLELQTVADQLLQTSDYVMRQSKHLEALLKEDDCIRPLQYEDYHQQLTVLSKLSLSAFSVSIRHFRHRHLLRLLLRERVGLASIEETMEAWSHVADALILHTLSYCNEWMSVQHGKPYDEQGRLVLLYPLALGKLGGRELNFSSDIDLIFVYSATGQTDGSLPLTNEQYFIKIIQQFIQLLQNITPDGFVFRVDLRLRPFGSSGALAMTLTAMETYYQEQGRDWERYAMVKARLIGHANSEWFERLITPFVYRRYVDFSVIESLRSMKAMIAREVLLNPALNDIKRGAGGIREIEFIIQCFQLIRGGRLRALQNQNAMQALSILAQEKLLLHVKVMQDAYLFYRKLENALQTYADHQTHSLPLNIRAQTYVLQVMGFANLEQLQRKLHQYQRIVSRTFRTILKFHHAYESEHRLLDNQIAQVWLGHVESNMAINLLASLGIDAPERCYHMIQAFRNAPKCRRLSQVARIRLDRFMVRLLNELVNVKNTDVVLLSIIQLLENIVGRSAYLALLTENHIAVRELLFWFSKSSFIASLLVNHPFLLDVLIFNSQIWKPRSRLQLQRTLYERLQQLNDREQQEDFLREFKLTCWINIACAELNGFSNALCASQFLTDVAQVIVLAVVDLACAQLEDKYPDIMRVKSQFTIIAYGKLGSREMNYDSDLDIVFLHEVSESDERLMIRLTQKILNMLTTRSRVGLLYQVDTRLKPSGSSGLLVSRLNSFVEYQCHQAWTWEHQALIKARILLGSPKVVRAFLKLKQTVLMRVREKHSLKHDVQNMRTKMNQQKSLQSLKYRPGGLLDLEFLTQYLVLLNPDKVWARISNTLLQLQHLHRRTLMTDDQFQAIKSAYEHFHQLLHMHFLQVEKLPVSEAHCQAVHLIYDAYLHP